MNKKTHLNLSNGDGIYHIAVGDITYISANGSCSSTHTIKGEKITCSNNLSAIGRKLEGDPQFIRIHKSFIVNLGQIKMYKKQDGGKVLMNDGAEITVARLRKKNLIQQLKK